MRNIYIYKEWLYVNARKKSVCGCVRIKLTRERERNIQIHSGDDAGLPEAIL